MAKKLDFKQMMLQQGERVALLVAGGLMLALVVYSLFMPGSGLFSGNPEEKAQALVKPTQQVNQRLSDPNNKPGPTDMPPPDAAAKRTPLDKSLVPGDKFMLARLTDPGDGIELGRRPPRVFTVEEAVARFNHVHVQSYLIDIPSDTIWVLKYSDGDGGGTTGKEGTAKKRPKAAEKIAGLMKSYPGMAGSTAGKGAPPGMRVSPNMMPSAEGEAKKQATLVPRKLSEIEKSSDPLAEQLKPMRMVVIGASFPYKQQVEEFRARLGLKSASDVLAERSTQKSKDQLLDNFRFLGVVVQRRELDGDGNPSAAVDRATGKPRGEWAVVDLNRDYRHWLVVTGRRFEPDPPDLAPVMVPGLVMPRLMQFREENAAKPHGGGGGTSGGAAFPTTKPDDMEKETKPDPTKDEYPPVEKDLTKIQATLKSLETKEAAPSATKPKRFTEEDDLDIFSVKTEGDKTTTDMPYPPMGGVKTPPTGGVKPPPRTPPDGTPPTEGAQQAPEPPDYCLVRLIDINVEPGRTYEYRLKVKMANPNYGRKDVASVGYSKEPVLESDWSKVPIVVRVPPEMRYYAVDQKAIERGYKGPYASSLINKERQTVLQVHRWVEEVNYGKDRKDRIRLTVGDWVVAERIPVARGEYVGRVERVPVPFWDSASGSFTVASNAPPRTRPGIPIYFGYGSAGGTGPEAILVDFDSGGKLTYEKVVSRTEDKVETRKVDDVFAGDALLLDPSGKLLLLESAKDVEDAGRKERLEKVRKHLKNAAPAKDKEKGKDKDKAFGDS